MFSRRQGMRFNRGRTASARRALDTSAAGLVFDGLVHDLSANAGLTHTGDDTAITAAVDQSGTGSDLAPSNAGGAVYLATGWVDGTEAVRFTLSVGLESGHASLISVFSGSAEWTVIMLGRVTFNSGLSWFWSCGDKGRASGHHWIAQGTENQLMVAKSNHAATGNITRSVTDVFAWQKDACPAIHVWRKVGATIQCFISGSQLTYNNSAYALGMTDHDTFIWGRGFAAAGAETGGGTMLLKRGLVYNRALSDAELAQNGRYLGIFGSLPHWGATLAESVAA